MSCKQHNQQLQSFDKKLIMFWKIILINDMFVCKYLKNNTVL